MSTISSDDLREHRRVHGALGYPYRQPGTPIDARFIEDRSIPEPNTGCWLWLGGVDKDGYGRFLGDEGKPVRASRASFSVFHGAASSGLLICHRCDNPACVNPEHLYAGTPTDNNQDTVRRGRRADKSGERHHLAKLSASDVKAIRASSQPQRHLSSVFGVSQQTISKIKRGKLWAA